MSQEYAPPGGTLAAGAPVAAPTDAPYSLLARLAAEAFGTFILVLGIVGTGVFNVVNNGTILTVALAGGIMLIAGIASVGHVSGGHFNPAVTFGMALVGRTAWKDLLPYWLAQFVAATAAAGVLWAIIPDSLVTALQLGSRGDALAATANGWGDGSPLSTLTGGQATFPFLNAVIVEIVIAAVFVGVVIAVTGKRARVSSPAVVIGLTLAALHIISWPVTNTSFNPARSLASVVFSGDGDAALQFLLFLGAPLVGAGLAALCALLASPAPIGATLAGQALADDVFDDDVEDDILVAEDVEDLDVIGGTDTDAANDDGPADGSAPAKPE